MLEYCNYHMHTHYSNFYTPDSPAKFEDYCKRAVQLGHKVVFATEHGYMGNLIEKFATAQKYDLEVVASSELYFVPNRLEKDSKNMHMIVIAKNKSGFKRLNKMISIANGDGFYYKPRVDLELLLESNPDDFYITTACIGGLLNDLDSLKKIISHFGKSNVFLEIQNHNDEKQKEYNTMAYKVHQKTGIRLIHGNDSHYAFKDDNQLRKIILSAKKMNYGNEDKFLLDYPHYDDILERYIAQDVIDTDDVIQALENTKVFAEGYKIFFDKEIKMPKIYPDKPREYKLKKLKSIINNSFKKELEHLRLKPNSEKVIKDYIEAIRFEFDIIESTFTEDYFLWNYDIIKRSKEKGGILTMTGRGSAPSFYINKLLGFTEIDRLDEEVKLFPTRFMSKSRILETKSLPDIDFNTANPQVFYDASMDIMGEHHVYPMVAFGTYQMSSAFKLVARAMDENINDYEKLSKTFSSTEIPDKKIRQSNFNKLKEDSRWSEITYKAERLIGVIESASEHPCAYLLLDDDIREELGVVKTKTNLVAMIDSGTSDDWKYLKNDFLKVEVWEIIGKTYEKLGIPIHTIRELKQELANNPKIWDLYSDGLTATLNQTTSDFARPLVRRYKPKSVKEMSGFVASIRPSFESLRDVFLNREPFSYNIKAFDELLQSSDNFILYQENIMEVLVFVGFPEDETYGLIKAISKKKPNVIDKIEKKFKDGFVRKTNSIENAEKVWKIIEDAVGYGFNSSHSLSVGYDSLYGAYLKHTYPHEYYTTVMNLYAGKPDKIFQISKELVHFGLKYENSKIGYSKNEYSYVGDTIYKSLSNVKFVGDSVSDELNASYQRIKEADGDLIDLFVDVEEQTPVNSRQMKILIKLDFFSEFGKAKTIYDTYEVFKKQYKKTHKDATKEKRIALVRGVWNDNKGCDYSLSEKLYYQYEYNNSIDYINDKVPEKLALIIDIDNRNYYSFLTLYRINDGSYESVSMKDSLIKRYEIKAPMMIDTVSVEHGTRVSKKTGMEYNYSELKQIKILQRGDNVA